MPNVKPLSQRTLVRLMETLRKTFRGSDWMYQFLYEHDFPDWFVIHARSHYEFDWQEIIVNLRNARFFYPGYCDSTSNITGEYLDKQQAVELSDALIERLAALATTLNNSQDLVNSLQLDGYQADTERLCLVPLEGPVSAQAEEDALGTLLRMSGIPHSATVLTHVNDATSLFVQGKHHPSLNESRNMLQALIDDMSVETDKHGGHAAKLPGGTANRIKYLSDVGFLTSDEKAAFESAWGALSAGSHPGVSERDEARIGLILALEFGQLLLLKFVNWSKNQYKKFA